MMVYPTETKLVVAMRENLTQNAGKSRVCKLGRVVRYVDYRWVTKLADEMLSVRLLARLCAQATVALSHTLLLEDGHYRRDSHRSLLSLSGLRLLGTVS